MRDLYTGCAVTRWVFPRKIHVFSVFSEAELCSCSAGQCWQLQQSLLLTSGLWGAARLTQVFPRWFSIPDLLAKTQQVFPIGRQKKRISTKQRNREARDAFMTGSRH